MSYKLVVVGGGSSYTPEIIEGVISVYDNMPCREIVLVDLPDNSEHSETVRDFSKRMLEAANKDISVTLTYDLQSALSGADFVISQFRTGRLSAREYDETQPLKSGLLGQETTGAGGFLCAMRTIPKALELAHAMEKHCPDACMINFTNPSGIITEAIITHSNIKCVGLCNIPISLEFEIAEMLKVSPNTVKCKIAGLNHLSFVLDVLVDGKSVMHDMLKRFAGAENDTQLMKNIPEVDGVNNLVADLGIIPSPYLQYYYFEDAMLKKQKQAAADPKGTRAQEVMRIESALFEAYKNPTLTVKPPELEQRGGAYYSYAAMKLIEALGGDTPKVHTINVKNNGAISFLPDNAVIEVDCDVSKSGINPHTIEIPPQIRGLLYQIKSYETLTVQAALSRKREDMIKALISHPLIHGYNNACKIAELAIDDPFK